MKPHQLFWRQEQTGRGKYKCVELVLPADHHNLGTAHTVNVALKIEAPPDSEFLLPTFIGSGQRKLLQATLCLVPCIVLCVGVFVGIVFILAVLAWSGPDGDTLAEEEAVTLSSNVSDSCTLTYDPDDISELMSEAYVRTFFNVACLATNGTGDPCDLHLAEEYTYRMFSALRLDRLVAEFLAFVAIFSLAQIGGIPRPTDWSGLFFWLAWMVTQLAQYVVILCALILQVFSFLGVRARLSPCLVQVDGTALLDFYAMCTFATQPELVIKATMLFVYSFLLSLGMLVFDGSQELSKLKVTAEATASAADSVTPAPSTPEGTRSVVEPAARPTAVESATGPAVTPAADHPAGLTHLEVEETHFTTFTLNLTQNPSNGSSEDPSPVSLTLTAAEPNTASAADPGGDEALHVRATTIRSLVNKLTARSPRAARFLQSLPKAIPRVTFEKDAAGPIMPKDKRFKARLSLALCHYHVARTIVLGACFSMWAALGSLTAAPGVTSAWVAALLVAVLTAPSPTYPGWRWLLMYSMTFGKAPLHFTLEPLPYIMSLFIICPLLVSASAILPLSALFMLVVEFAYFLGLRVLALIASSDDNSEQVWVELPERLATRCCCKWTDALAGPTHTCLSWIQSTSIFSYMDGVLGRSQGKALAFTSTSYATLAGGLSCFWLLLALSPVASHAAWARARSLIPSEGAAGFANDTSLEVGDVDGLTGEWSWAWDSLMVWLWLAVAIIVAGCATAYCCSKAICNIATIILCCCSCCGMVKETWINSSLRERWLAKTAGACSLFALIIFIFTATQTVDAKELIATTYASSSGALSGLQLDWNGALPSFDELVKVLNDPAAALSSVVQRIANLSSYAKFDPAYFSEGVQALTAINLVLSFVKLLATYGRKLFALMDAAKSILKTHTGLEAASEGDDGTVQVCKTMTDLAAIAILDLLNKQDVKAKYGEEVSFAKLVLQEELNFDNCDLNNGDMARLVALVTHPEMAVKLRSLSLEGNALTDMSTKTLTHMLIKGSMTILSSLNLKANYIGTKGAKVIAKALRVNSSLTRLNLCQNQIGDEGAKAIGAALAVNGSLAELNFDGFPLPVKELKGTKPVKFLDLSSKALGRNSAVVIAALIGANDSLTKLE